MKVRVKEVNEEKYLNKNDLIREMKELADYLATGNKDARDLANAYRRITRELQGIH